jgi:hypothetical protein
MINSLARGKAVDLGYVAMKAVRASILFSGVRLKVTSTCSFSSAELAGPVVEGDAVGRVTFSVTGEVPGDASGEASGFDCVAGLSCGVALVVSTGDGFVVGSAIEGEAAGEAVTDGVSDGDGFGGGTVSVGCGDCAAAGAALGDASGVDEGVG